MDGMFERPWGSRGTGRRSGARVAPLPVDVYATPKELVIRASMPGLDPEDVEITIEGETLTLPKAEGAKPRLIEVKGK